MTQAVPYAVIDLVERRLHQKLQDEGSDVVVLRADSMERMPRNVPRALIVIPSGLRVDEQTRRQVAIAEEFVVVVAVRNASTQTTGEASQEDAGPLLSLVVSALLGWEPDEPYAPVSMTTSPSPDHEGGYGYYPLAFETIYILTGVPS